MSSDHESIERSWSLRRTILLSDLDPVKKLILMGLDAHAPDMGAGTYPSKATLGICAGVTDRTVYEHLKDLIAMEVVQVVRQGGGRGRPTVYRLNVKAISRLEENHEDSSGFSVDQPDASKPCPDNLLEENHEDSSGFSTRSHRNPEVEALNQEDLSLNPEVQTSEEGVEGDEKAARARARGEPMASRGAADQDRETGSGSLTETSRYVPPERPPEPGVERVWDEEPLRGLWGRAWSEAEKRTGEIVRYALNGDTRLDFVVDRELQGGASIPIRSVIAWTVNPETTLQQWQARVAWIWAELFRPNQQSTKDWPWTVASDYPRPSRTARWKQEAA